jgi:hypothetical protein
VTTTWRHPKGSRSKFGKHSPDGIQAGVRRGAGSGGMLSTYNGHRHIPEPIRAAILDFMARLGRPTTVAEVAGEVGYGFDHTCNVMTWMARDGDLQRLTVGRPTWGKCVLYGLPPQGKTCTKCEQVRPLEHFQRDRSTRDGLCSRCRFCRSPKADKSKVRAYPDAARLGRDIRA